MEPILTLPERPVSGLKGMISPSRIGFHAQEHRHIIEVVGHVTAVQELARLGSNTPDADGRQKLRSERRGGREQFFYLSPPQGVGWQVCQVIPVVGRTDVDFQEPFGSRRLAKGMEKGPLILLGLRY